MKATLATPDAEWVLELDAATQTAKVLSYTPRARSLPAQVSAWARAEASMMLHGPLADEPYEARIAVCRTCDQLDPRDAPQVGFCKACGCGVNARAELTVKGRMPAATCPRGKWPAQ
jgi:hypothetical protein